MLWVLKMVEQMDLRKEMSEWPAPPSKYAGFRAMVSELMIGFWFGIRIVLAVRVVDGLNYCIGALLSSRIE